MHDFSTKIIIRYHLLLTVAECKKVVRLPSITAESSSGITSYTGPKLRPIPILEFWDNSSQRH